MSRLSIPYPTGQTSKGLLEVVILRAAKVEIANPVASISAASVVYPRFWTPLVVSLGAILLFLL